MARLPIVFCVTFIAATATAQIQSIGNCKVIDKPGSYVLAKNIDASPKDLNTVPITVPAYACIDIETDFVTLDLQGYTIAGVGIAFDSRMSAITINGRHDVVVRNGNVTAFDFGIIVQRTPEGIHSRSIVIENIRASANRFGVVASSTDASSIAHCIATRNVHGIVFNGTAYRVVSNIAFDNDNEGIMSQLCPGCVVIQNAASGNPGGDIVVPPTVVRFENNPAP